MADSLLFGGECVARSPPSPKGSCLHCGSSPAAEVQQLDIKLCPSGNAILLLKKKILN